MSWILAVAFLALILVWTFFHDRPRFWLATAILAVLTAFAAGIVVGSRPA